MEWNFKLINVILLYLFKWCFLVHTHPRMSNMFTFNFLWFKDKPKSTDMCHCCHLMLWRQYFVNLCFGTKTVLNISLLQESNWRGCRGTLKYKWEIARINTGGQWRPNCSWTTLWRSWGGSVSGLTKSVLQNTWHWYHLSILGMVKPTRHNHQLWRGSFWTNSTPWWAQTWIPCS